MLPVFLGNNNDEKAYFKRFKQFYADKLTEF